MLERLREVMRRDPAPEPVAEDPPEPLVLTVTRALTRDVARQLEADVDRAYRRAPVVIDVSAVPAFDSEGAEALAGLQDQFGPQRLRVVGMHQAAARLTGAALDEPVDVPPIRGEELVVTQLHRTSIVHPKPGSTVTAADIERALTAAMVPDVGIVVIDLREAGAIHPSVVAALAEASSEVAVRGRELLIVNVTADMAERLHRSGLSATTFVAPQPTVE